MAELSAKKAKKRKQGLPATPDSEAKAKKNAQSVPPTPELETKAKKTEQCVPITPGSGNPAEMRLNGQESLTPASAKKSKKQKLKNVESGENNITTTEDSNKENSECIITAQNSVASEKLRRQKEKRERKLKKKEARAAAAAAARKKNGDAKGAEGGGKSNVRTSQHRMMADFDYIAGLMQLVHIPQHKTALETTEDDDDTELIAAQTTAAVVNGGRAATHEELRERLHLKMAAIRDQHAATNDARAKRKKLKRLGVDSAKAAQKEELKQKLIQVGKQAIGGKIKKETVGALGANVMERPKVKTETGKVVFSKFDFTADEVAADVKTASKKKNLDPKAALAKMAKQKELLARWEEKGRPEKVKRIENSMAWTTALEKAEGVKVKDDVELLKRSLKRQEAAKKASKRKWAERDKEVERKREGQQAKRKENLGKRKKEAKAGKMKKLVKKGRHVPT